MRKSLVAVSFLSLALAACGNPDTPGGRAADARHESFEGLGDAMKAAGDELKKNVPDMAVVRTNAEKIDELAGKLPTWFPSGSGPQDGMKTDTLEAVWTKPAEFKQAADNFAAEASKFRVATVAGDVAAIGGGMKALGGTCKACHDKFKAKD